MVGLRFAFLALFLVSCGKLEPSVSIYPVRAPFEYVLISRDQNFGTRVLNVMVNQCERSIKSGNIELSSYEINESSVIIYFKCKVGN